jgi:hypothetical protein
MYVISGVIISESKWNDVFNKLKSCRRYLRESDGIYIFKEFHACELVAGRGKISPNTITKYRRCRIYNEFLKLISILDLKIINGISTPKKQDWLFERVINRLNKFVEGKNTYAILICDEGKEIEYTKKLRKMRVQNLIPSAHGYWPQTRKSYRNLPISNIIEDPVFKDSKKSYFIQMADCVAFSLLRKEHPTQKALKYGFNNSFDLLKPVLLLKACKKDDNGIVRIKK